MSTQTGVLIRLVSAIRNSRLTTLSSSTCLGDIVTNRHQHSSAYQVEVAIKAFEPKYLKAAAGTIRDLLLLNFAPKGPSALAESAAAGQKVLPVTAGSTGHSVSAVQKFVRRAPGPVGRRGRPGSGASVTVLPSGTRLPQYGKHADATSVVIASPVRLVVPPAAAVDVPVNWSKSRFTLIRGPHVDKRGMEQFEMRKYKALLYATTNSSLEVRWFMNQLKMYDLTGVQVQVILTSNTYLTPGASTRVGASLAKPPGAIGGVLADHVRRTAEPYLATRLPQPSTAERLRQLQATLAADTSSSASSSSSSSTSASSSSSRGRHGVGSVMQLQQELAQRLQQLRGLPDSEAAAFLATVDAVMLGMRFDALQQHQNAPFRFATFAPAQSDASASPDAADAEAARSQPRRVVPDAAWMMRMLKYGQLTQRLAMLSQEQQLIKAYTEYGHFAHTLLHQLLALWAAGTDKRGRSALPPTQAELLKMLEQGRHSYNPAANTTGEAPVQS